MSANEIKARREALHWTQEELAAKAGLSGETVRKVEKGLHVRAKSVDAILAALAVAETVTSPSSGAELRVTSERPERNVVRISAQAIGWELSATYTDAEDRQRALEDIGKAWSSIMGGTGSSGGSREGGQDQPDA